MQYLQMQSKHKRLPHEKSDSLQCTLYLSEGVI